MCRLQNNILWKRSTFCDRTILIKRNGTIRLIQKEIDIYVCLFVYIKWRVHIVTRYCVPTCCTDCTGSVAVAPRSKHHKRFTNSAKTKMIVNSISKTDCSKAKKGLRLHFFSFYWQQHIFLFAACIGKKPERRNDISFVLIFNQDRKNDDIYHKRMQTGICSNATVFICQHLQLLSIE